MPTEILNVSATAPQEAVVSRAGRAIADGQLVIFPTETVYGIAASAVSAQAIAALSALKDRSPDKPFTLHLADPDEAEVYVGPLPRVARRLMRKVWPGPLTLVVPDRRPDPERPAGLIHEAISYRGFVGLRCPNHAAARAVLRAAGVPVAGTSANLGGGPPAHSVPEALSQLEGLVPLAVDAGPTPLAHASSVVRVTGDDAWEVLREGALTARRVARLARTRVLFICTGNMCRSPMAEGLARRMLADRIGCSPAELPDHGLEVASAGTAAMTGGPASDNAIAAMAERGIDLTGHQAQAMTVDALQAADYIWVMTHGHRQAVLGRAPEVLGRVNLVDPAGRDVADPIGGDLETYRACAGQIEAALVQRLAEII
jgi:protein-tyrosine phosphatase